MMSTINLGIDYSLWIHDLVNVPTVTSVSRHVVTILGASLGLVLGLSCMVLYTMY